LYLIGFKSVHPAANRVSLTLFRASDTLYRLHCTFFLN